MHAELSAAAKSAYPISRFRDAYAATAATATATTVSVGQAKGPEDEIVSVPVTVRTRVFGQGARHPAAALRGQAARTRASPGARHSRSPASRRGRRSSAARSSRRAGTILARDGQALAKGPDRSTSLTAAAAETVGEMGPIPPDQRRALRALGYPDDAPVGTSGLERALQPQLAGRPGGTLSVGGRVLARSRPRPAARRAHDDQPEARGGGDQRAGRPERGDRRASSPAPATCWRWPGRRTRPPARPAPRSRS